MSFTELGVSSILVEALKLAGFSEPTSVQKHALPLLLNKQHLSAIERLSDDRETSEETVDDASTSEQKQQQATAEQKEQEPDAVLAAETGSGKTLVYAISAIERLCRTASGVDAQVLITSPSHELCSQIHRCVHSLLLQLESECDISCTMLLPCTYKHEFRPAKVPLTRRSIVIGSPSMLNFHWNRSGQRRPGTGEVVGKHARVLQFIIDEADMMLESNDTRTEALIRCLDVAEVKASPLLLVGASFSSKGLRSTVKRLAGMLSRGALWIRSPTLHHIPARIQQSFQSVRDSIKPKADAVVAILSADANAHNQRVLIFCNTSASAIALCKRLNFIAKRDALDKVNDKDDKKMKREGDEEFEFICKGVRVGERLKRLARFESGSCLRLVCTDLASRGLDYGGQHIAHVIEADLALNAIDHLHRLGRTGRAGRSGRATSLVGGVGASDLAARLQELAANQTSQSLEQLFSRKRMLAKKLKKSIRAQKLADDDDDTVVDAADDKLSTAQCSPTS